MPDGGSCGRCAPGLVQRLLADPVVGVVVLAQHGGGEGRGGEGLNDAHACSGGQAAGATLTRSSAKPGIIGTGDKDQI